MIFIIGILFFGVGVYIGTRLQAALTPTPPTKPKYKLDLDAKVSFSATDHKSINELINFYHMNRDREDMYTSYGDFMTTWSANHYIYGTADYPKVIGGTHVRHDAT